jgi:glycosyltransferase involved in cell wall biosynthesis
MSKIKILFFTNNLNRTGAEVVLFNLIVRLNSHRFDIGVLLLGETGELVSELPAYIEVHKLNTDYQLTDKIKHYFGVDVLQEQIQVLQKNYGYTVWYFNTIRPAYLLKYASRFNVRTISHIHELASNYSNLSSQIFNDLLKSDAIIACSKLVEEEIGLAYDGQLTRFNSAIDKAYISAFNIQLASKSTSRTAIVCAGSISDRKGTDIFLKVAELLKDKPYDFVWLGQFSDTGYSNWIQKTQYKLNLSNVTFKNPNSQLDYYSVIGQSDVFFSTSREESLGLSMMEAIYLGKPVVALNSGGSSLIVDESNGLIIHSFDAENIAHDLNDFIETRLSHFINNVSTSVLNEYDLQSEFIRWESLLMKIAL